MTHFFIDLKVYAVALWTPLNDRQSTVKVTKDPTKLFDYTKKTHQIRKISWTDNNHSIGLVSWINVKYKRTDALSLWHQQYSTMMDNDGPLQTRGETRCPGGVSVSCLASCTRHECPRHNESVSMEAWHYIGSVKATTHQGKCIITLVSNPSRGTVLPAPQGKGNKGDKNVKYKRTDALLLGHQQ